MQCQRYITVDVMMSLKLLLMLSIVLKSIGGPVQLACRNIVKHEIPNIASISRLRIKINYLLVKINF